MMDIHAQEIAQAREGLRRALSVFFLSEEVAAICRRLDPFLEMSASQGFFEWGHASLVPEDIVHDIERITSRRVREIDCVLNENTGYQTEHAGYLDDVTRFHLLNKRPDYTPEEYQVKALFSLFFRERLIETFNLDYNETTSSRFYVSLFLLVGFWLLDVFRDDTDLDHLLALTNIIDLASQGCVFLGFWKDHPDVAVIACK